VEALTSLPTKRIVLAVAALAAVALVGGYGVSMRSRPKATAIDLGTPKPSASAGAASADGFYVHVAGAVNRPGLYRLAPGSRVDDAIRIAGGPTADADLNALNLATKVKDGDKVLVPKRGEAAAGSDGGGAGPGQSQTVNLNTATADQLDALPGIGPALAQRIVAYREQHGGFRTVDELQKVPGIGPSKFAQLKDLVTV
jgi:competence protein ComEA